jgi:predicted PurR-regulated permease PerM
VVRGLRIAAAMASIMTAHRKGSGSMLRELSLEHAFFLLLLMIVSVAFVWIVLDFLQPVFWAALLASLFQPVQIWLLPRLRSRESLAALIVLTVILLIVVLPLFFVGFAVTSESVALYQRVTSGEIALDKPLQWATETMPTINDLLHRAGITPDRITEWLSSAAVTTSRFVAGRALAFGQNALSFTVQFLLMVYLTFFFVRDGARLIEQLVHVLPIGDDRERRMFAKFTEVSRATIKGTGVVGIVQGALGGLTFALLGFNGAVFWGVVMTVLSILPAVGASLVWIPAAIWLVATGEIGKGVFLVVVGMLIGLVDNVLRPILVGRDTKMPDYLILLSTLGGITALGVSGFVIGPIVASLFLAAWNMFAEDFREAEAGDGV